MLNIGVGNGYLESILVQKGLSVSCLDPSASAIEKIRARLGLGAMAQVGYSQAIPFSHASFDYVIMSEVLEHLDDTAIKESLKEVQRVLKNGGRLMGTVPADENLKEGIAVCPKCGEYFHRWGHMQSFSQERLLNMLSHDFTDVSIKRVILNDFKQLNLKGKALAALKMLQVLMNLKGSTQNLYFVAKNQE